MGGVERVLPVDAEHRERQRLCQPAAPHQASSNAIETSRGMCGKDLKPPTVPDGGIRDLLGGSIGRRSDLRNGSR